MHTIRLKDDYIKLGQALKAAGRSGKSKRTDRDPERQKAGIRR